MYDAELIAEYIIDYSNENNYGISNLKLQKILYFIQAEFLVSKKNNSPCFKEDIEAMSFGPVIQVVYQKYKIYDRMNIPSNKFNKKLKGISDKKINFEDKLIINSIIDTLQDYSSSGLLNVIYNQKPWKNAYDCCYDKKISNESIMNFFKK